MRTHLHLLTAACLGTSALLFAAQSMAADNVTNSNLNNNAIMAGQSAAAAAMPSLPAGITAKDLNSDKSIENAFKAVSNDAMDKTGFDNLVGKLVDQDRDRIKKSTNNSLTNLDGNKNKSLTDVISSLDNNWKSKYGHNFKVDDVGKVYTTDFLHIVTGEVSDPSLLVGKWPVDAGFGLHHGGTLTQSDASLTQQKNFGGDINLEKGRKVAIAQLSMRHGMPAINASLIHEAGGWKFDVPNTINAQQLYDNLVSNLTYLNNHQDSWPADVHEADGMLSHGVVAALYGLDLQKMPTERTAQER